MQNHRFIAIKRSPVFGDTLVVSFLKFLIFLPIVVYLFAIGFFADIVIKDISIISFAQIFVQFVVIGIMVDYIVKLFIVKSKIDNIYPYLTLPIPRFRLFTHSIFSSFVAPINYVSFIVMVSFFAKMLITQQLSVTFFIAYCILTLSVSFFNSALVRWVKSFCGVSRVIVVAVVSLIYVLLLAMVAGSNLMAKYLIIWFSTLVNVYIVSIFLLVAACVFILSQCKRELYKCNEDKESHINLTLRFVNISNNYANLILRIILATKIKYSILCLTLVFAIQVFNCFSNGLHTYFLLAFLTFTFSIFGISTISINIYSTAIDGLVVRHDNFIERILKAWYTLSLCFAVLLATVMSFFVDKVVCLTALLITIGYSLPIVSLVVVYVKDRIDPFLSGLRQVKGQLAEFVIITAAIILQIILSVVWGIFQYSTIVCLIICIPAGISVLTIPMQIKKLNKMFKQRRYENLAGMRA